MANAMAEITNELIDEVVKAAPARLGNLEEAVRETRGGARALRSGVAAIDTRLVAFPLDLAILYEAQAAMDNRMSRIERRLDIIDTPQA
jgi:hypothetical protein